MAEKKAILVIGAGDATGGAIAKRLAREGYVACVTRRSADKLAPLVEEIGDRQRLSFDRPHLLRKHRALQNGSVPV